MGTSALKTDWKCIGRSGNTVDGRTIDPEALKQAAKNYDPKLFKALIWPDHLRWFNMGGVEEVKAVGNSEGGVDLFAILAPNDIYLNTVSAGQRLFTSMELLPNFRKTGEWYLTGLAATDNPASSATTEMRFSSLKEKDTVVTDFVENTTRAFTKEEEAPNWFRRFTDKFKNTEPTELTTEISEDDMDKALLEKISAQMQAFSAQLAGTLALTAKTDEPTTVPAQDYAALSAKFEAQATEIAEFKTKLEAFTKVDYAAELNKLNATVTELALAFTKAIGEQNGTSTSEHTGNTDVTGCL